MRKFYMPPMLAILLLIAILNVQAKQEPAKFGIFISSLSGKYFKQIISDSYREMNHVRVSPDHKTITFTRFNKRGFFSRIAEEDAGYTNTEIMIADIDGANMTSLTPTGKYLINVNSYWTPDGKGLIYMSNDNPDKRKLRIKHIDIETRIVTDISPSIFSWVSDPHQVGDVLVFPAVKKNQNTRAIWSINLKSKKVKQLTFPQIAIVKKNAKRNFSGDSDPKLSPDGKMLAFTRCHSDKDFENIVLNLNTGKEFSISARNVIDVMPEWSSDGKLLAFWHVDMKNFKNIGIYTIKPDGTNRSQIPLPPGYHFKMPAFFPNDGSTPETRIIFSAKKVPQIR